MKKLITHTLGCLLFCFLYSCGSEDSIEPESNYYFRFKVNGVQNNYSETVNQSITFQGWSWSDLSLDNGLLDTRVFAAKSINDGGKNSILFDLYHSSPLQTNHNYSNHGTSAMVDPEFLVLGIYDENGTMFYTDNLGWNKYNGGVNDATIRFNEITENSLKGTFSGTLYSTKDIGENLSITEGEFHVRLAGF
ncbi:hypothetical protein J2X69_002053 [Algoriphagus sp. 4150]|uniref:hypothetical protein n=1 Tax=Algoriphagus sp. 4150 TaxID=2817756 RepID=UPI0028663750|nr:hypothetical protein [Algoriphagus sp. 4150]MDR7129708.1 hypothetical protein [Algoriphagus sp. 4150]